MLRGIHIQSTAPSSAQRQDYHLSCLYVSSMVLSALLWRKNCGTIKLYTDSVFYAYLISNGLTELWDGGIDTETIDAIPPSVNQSVFWAAAKLFALHDAPAPVAMVDGDLFFWRDISKDMNLENLTVLHKEELWDCYVSRDSLGTPPDYQFDSRWDWTESPYNTAFAYFPHQAFKDAYTEEAIRFMTDNCGQDAKPSSQMVFAEQRLLAMCAKRDNIPVKTLIDNPFDGKNDSFTHLWGAKARANKNVKDMKHLISAILSTIKELNQDYYTMLSELYQKGLDSQK